MRLAKAAVVMLAAASITGCVLPEDETEVNRTTTTTVTEPDPRFTTTTTTTTPTTTTEPIPPPAIIEINDISEFGCVRYTARVWLHPDDHLRRALPEIERMARDQIDDDPDEITVWAYNVFEDVNQWHTRGKRTIGACPLSVPPPEVVEITDISYGFWESASGDVTLPCSRWTARVILRTQRLADSMPEILRTIHAQIPDGDAHEITVFAYGPGDNIHQAATRGVRTEGACP